MSSVILQQLREIWHLSVEVGTVCSLLCGIVQVIKLGQLLDNLENPCVLMLKQELKFKIRD